MCSSFTWGDHHRQKVMETAEKVVPMTAASRRIELPSYRLLVSRSRRCHHRARRAKQSTAERPGRRNTGRMMRVIMVPTNSSRPKSSSKGSSRPAKMKTENSTGNRSCSTRPPVDPERSTSGPASKKVNSTKTPPSTRTHAQKGETLNRLLRKGRFYQDRRFEQPGDQGHQHGGGDDGADHGHQMIGKHRLNQLRQHGDGMVTLPS